MEISAIHSKIHQSLHRTFLGIYLKRVREALKYDKKME